MNPSPHNSTPRPIELLSPARNLACGLEAIRHGADAVYIGGPNFGARVAAGNSMEDIRALCDYAHLFGAKIYLTLNTILYDSELAAAEQLTWEAYEAGVDALIIQDLGLLNLHLPPLPLHASTQMDNQSVEKAQWLEAAGFSQIVVARETTLSTIRSISRAVKTPIEAFVHGALCVSLSGRCFASQHCFQRSANRGCCAQFCRLAFNLLDGQGRTLIKQKYLLSLRDLNRADYLEEMMDAGVSSFKIEGRLKDVDYVKNVTARFRQELDKVLRRRPQDFKRASFGNPVYNFTPNLHRTFNRGFTDYFFSPEPAAPIHSFYSPKAIGPKVGQAVHTSRKSFTFKPHNPAAPPITAGDGLCFLDEDGKLQGFRVNKVEGNEIFPATMPRLQAGTELHRNLDFAFSRLLAKPSARRTLEATLTLKEIAEGFTLEMADETGCQAAVSFECPHTEAHTPQHENLLRQLSKLGTTHFTAREVIIQTQGERFIPASLLSENRRKVCQALLQVHQQTYRRPQPAVLDHEALKKLTPKRFDFTANVSNSQAEAFLKSHGAEQVAPAYEVSPPQDSHVLMTCHHCIRRALNACFKTQPREAKALREPLSLQLPDGQTFPLRFNCRQCLMQVLSS